MNPGEPAHDVLADLLVMASEAGPERLVTTDQLLRELVGPEAVNAAHAVWTDRLREGLAGVGSAEADPAATDPDVFELTRRLRASTPVRGGRW